MIKNYYGNLCTEMYEILHKEAPLDELGFYISYAEKGMSILEPLCGSGRFLVPFLEKGFDIVGMDLSKAVSYTHLDVYKRQGKARILGHHTADDTCQYLVDRRNIVHRRTKGNFIKVRVGCIDRTRNISI